MRLSVNELETLARKAAIGAGIDYGHAQELALSCIWLCAVKFQGVCALSRALKNWEKGLSGSIDYQLKDQRLYICGKKQIASVFYAAPAARDFIELIATKQSIEYIHIQKMDEPCLAFAQLNKQTSNLNIRFQVYCATDNHLIWCGESNSHETHLSTPACDDVCAPCVAEVKIQLEQNQIKNDTRAKRLYPDYDTLYREGIWVSDNNYQTLLYFFKKTLVPDSELSRARGAGAGLIDSD